jgi:hypothetical protein
MVNMPLSILKAPQPIFFSMAKDYNTPYPGGVQHGVNENDPAPPLHFLRASQEICPAPD